MGDVIRDQSSDQTHASEERSSTALLVGDNDLVRIRMEPGPEARGS